MGHTADARGIGQLADVKYLDNANGTYTIKTAGTATEVALHGVGKVAMGDGRFPQYDVTLTVSSQTPAKIN